MSRTSAAAALVPRDEGVEYAEPEELNSFDGADRIGDDLDEVEEMLSFSNRDRRLPPSALERPASRSALDPGLAPAAAHKSGTLRSSIAELTDQELLEGLRAESEPHFAELYNRYFQRIYNFVYARMRNHAETEEVVQETFLAVFRSFGNYRGQSSLLSWIYGIAKNTTNNSLRCAKSQNERIELADDEDLIPRPSIELAMPDEQLDLHRFREQLTERLDSLATWQAEIFEMRHFENLSIPEISKRTSRSSDAVRSSLYRVKRIFFDAAVASGSGSLAGGGES